MYELLEPDHLGGDDKSKEQEDKKCAGGGVADIEALEHVLINEVK